MVKLSDRNRRIAGAGVAGVLVLALGAVVVAPAMAEISADAAMMQTTTSTVPDAVADAVAQAEAHSQQVAAQQQAIVDLAVAQTGDAYVSGAEGPDVFDCSGLTLWVYQQVMGITLPHNTHAQWNAIEDTWYAGEKEPQPGDLVFFFENGADHVGIYIGDGMMVSAQSSGSAVTVAPIYSGYWAPYLTGFGRIIQ